MADEIKVTTKLTLTNGFLNDTQNVSNLSVDQTTARKIGGTQTIGFAASEDIYLGDVATPGFAFFRNLDATNSINIGQNISAGGFDKLVVLRPGEVALFRIDLATGGVLQAQAVSADCELQYVVYED